MRYINVETEKTTQTPGISWAQQTDDIQGTFKRQVTYCGSLRTKKATAKTEIGPPSQCLHSATPLSSQDPDPKHITLLFI